MPAEQCATSEKRLFAGVENAGSRQDILQPDKRFAAAVAYIRYMFNGTDYEIADKEYASDAFCVALRILGGEEPPRKLPTDIQ